MAIIGVTGTGSVVGQAILKSIKKSSFKDEKLVGMDYFENTVGSYWTDKNYILPDILDENITENIWLDKIMSIIKEEKIDILFIGVDFELHLFAKYKELIEKETSCLVVVSSDEIVSIADDKYLTYEFLKKNNLFYPETFLYDDIYDAIKNNKIDFPMIIKPRKGYRSVDVFLVTNKEELEDKIKKVSNPVIQEYIGSSDTEYTCGVISFDNDVKASIALRRDLKDGTTVTTYLKNDYPAIIKEYIENVAKKLCHFGVCNFQLRLDSSGIPKIFEINARHSGTTYIRTLYGFNEIEYILEYLLNKKSISFNIKEGIVKRYFEEFMVGDKL